jgi:hypothetical protein
LKVIAPERGGIVVGQVGAQEIASLAPSRLAQLAAIEAEAPCRSWTSWQCCGFSLSPHFLSPLCAHVHPTEPTGLTARANWAARRRRGER